MIEPHADRPTAIKLDADKVYDAEHFVNELRSMNVTPHVAQNTSGRSSAIDERTTRRGGIASAFAQRTSDHADSNVFSTLMAGQRMDTSITLDDHTSAQLSSLSLERVDRIHTAISVSAGCSGHALVIGRELAIARISPSTSLQAINVLPSRRNMPPRSGDRRGSRVNENGKCKHTNSRKIGHETSSLLLLLLKIEDSHLVF